MSQEIDYNVVLADLEARREALEAAIAGVRYILGQGVETRPSGTNSQLPFSQAESLPDAVTPGVFHGLSVSEAAKKFLLMTRAKQKNSVICEALRAGGIESSAKSFYGAVFTTLRRNKDFKRMGNYWALASWYPNLSTPAKPKARKKRKAAPRPQEPKQAAKAGAEKASTNLKAVAV